MPFETFAHYVQPTPPPPPPPTPKKRFFLDIFCQFVKKITNTESSWQIIQIRKKLGGVGEGGDVCGLGEWGGVVVSGK